MKREIRKDFLQDLKKAKATGNFIKLQEDEYAYQMPEPCEDWFLGDDGNIYDEDGVFIEEYETCWYWGNGDWESAIGLN